MIRFFFAGLVSSLLVFGAAADRVNEAIATYNAVINSSDAEAKLVAAEALGEAAMVATERDDAALLAFEAAKTLCLANACKIAQPYANWALSKGQHFEEVSLEDFAVLSSYADWRVRSNRANRAALDEALTKIVNAEPSVMSVAIFQIRYLEDVADGRWERGAHAAKEAAEHFEPVKAVIGQQWSHAKTASIASAFNDEPDLEHLFAFARLERELNDMHSAYHEANGDEPHADWFDSSRYAVQAWRHATEAYIKSTTHRTSAKAQSLDEQVDALLNYTNSESETRRSSGLPLCEGDLNRRPALFYPVSAVRKGQFGAVIMRLSVTDGKVSAVEPLAAVPSDGFKETAARTVSKWKWKTDVPESEIGVTCGLDRENMILPLIFQLR